MQEYRAKLKIWWSNLAVREQRTVLLGSALVSIFMVYQFIWSPLMNHVASLRRQIQTQQKALIWMQAVDKQLQQHHNQRKREVASPVSLLSYLQKRVQQAGLEPQLAQLQQTSSDLVEMRFKKVEFDKFIHLLTNIVEEQSASITQLDIIAENTPGMVNTGVVFKIQNI